MDKTIYKIFRPSILHILKKYVLFSFSGFFILILLGTFFVYDLSYEDYISLAFWEVMLPRLWQPLLFLSVIAVFLSLLIYQIGDVGLCEGKIKSRTLFGNSKTLLLKDISSVQYFGFLGFSFLRLYTNSTRFPVWMPLFINEYNEFCSDILNMTDDSSPLHDFFESYRI
ncbi:hypothetical protein KKA14_21875 [bacterium]|nr:hypothetical protein [bacterium]